MLGQDHRQLVVAAVGLERLDGAAFDLVRASINLVLAGLLIALGTSLKLPLSTTYVTFMVAMGTSLADRAWGRDSAVFRITGCRHGQDHDEDPSAARAV